VCMHFAISSERKVREETCLMGSLSRPGVFLVALPFMKALKSNVGGDISYGSLLVLDSLIDVLKSLERMKRLSGFGSVRARSRGG
jgi:hypothetical protein